jgi:hypothetical protein
MPVPRIILNTPQRNDLAIACAVGKDGLERVARKLENTNRTIQRSVVDAIIKSEIGDKDGEVVSRLLFGLAGPLRREIGTVEELLDGISQAIESNFKSDTRLTEWPTCKPAFLRLLRSSSVSLSAKALDISYDFERVYTSSRFLTNVRPVYTEPHDAIVGATIVHTLRLDYITANGEENSISLAIDHNDIQKLQAACKDALEKASLAKTKFEGRNDGVEIIIPSGGMS